MMWGRTREWSFRAFAVVMFTMSVSILYQAMTVSFPHEVAIQQTARENSDRSSNHEFIHLSNDTLHSPNKIDAPTRSSPCYFQVQIWTHRSHGTNGSTISCPGLPCGVHQVEDTSLKTLEKSDIVFFEPLSKWDWQEVHTRKRPGQVWMTGTWESPINTRKHIIPPQKYLNNTYEYVISFRRHPRTFYGDFGKFDRSKPSVIQNESRNWAEGKTGVAVWVAKNCHRNNLYLRWNRTEFVRALSKLVKVDLYGPCGDEECPRYNRTCHEKIKAHKFYLAFENCKCRNYITEKVWSNSFQFNLVPVVYGPPKEDYELVLPPNSFIFIEDFKNVKELADYLTLLDKRDDLYNKYHDWRNIGRTVLTPKHTDPLSMCSVVKRMLEDERAKAAGTYTPLPPFDWDSWWLGSCHNLKDFPIDI